MTSSATSVDFEALIHWFDSSLQDRASLGGKGASLARMAGSLGLPVPPGFTLTTQAWKAFASDGSVITQELVEAVRVRLDALGERLHRRPDDPERPLLLSVRSGAPVSMPGMMDTVLNIGLNDEVVHGLARQTSQRFAEQSYLRLLATYADVVREIPAADIAALEEELAEQDDHDRIESWKRLIAAHGEPFPQTTLAQVREGIEAVWRSWNRPRAQRYRKFRGIPEDLGTAVTVQAMVFGNLDEDSGTGVVFTRDPGTGEKVLYGDFMWCAQGEDVVSGTVDPEPVGALRGRSEELWEHLQAVTATLESDTADMCDIEFTVQHGRLYLLQTRPGQRSPAAAVRIAVELVREQLIDVETAVGRVTLGAVQQLQAPRAIGLDSLREIGTGVPASPGTGVGRVVFDSARAESLAAEGITPVLLCPTTSPQDINGMIVSSAVVTGHGGRASHAAVVARGMGKPAVCGVEAMSIDAHARRASFTSGAVLAEGDPVTVDGHGGRLLLGTAQFADPVPDEWLAQLLGWCDAYATLPVLDEAPAGAHRICGPDDEVPGNGPVVIDVPWEGADSETLLVRTCREVFEQVEDGTPVHLVLPAELGGIDFRPPAGPWAGVVAPRSGDWASRVLALRLTWLSRPAAEG